MPKLTWVGKEKVINHHHEVPFRVLEHQYNFSASDNNSQGNKIIHGDNLEALKSLLPEYEGKIKCIYIDPPYNTGNEGWVYNDNVSDEKIKKWLGQVVGKEGEDLSRHDKWLCMMYPRLKILEKLLADNGIICVSVDDNEVFSLGILMDEIFGRSKRLANAPWLAEPSGGKEKTGLRGGHEYIVIYGNINSLTREMRSTGELNQKDKWGKYRKGRELRKWGGISLRYDRENQWFPLKTPDGIEVFPYRNDGKEGHWRWGKDQKMKEIIEDPEKAHWELCTYDEGVIVNGETERYVPFEKIRDKQRSVGWNTWLDSYGFNADGTRELKEIFGEKIFDTPKPTSLIKWLISLHEDENSLILDSFAGSGTTAHSVLKLNEEDGGNRKFILIETMDYAETITAERVKRVMQGYGENSKAVEGLGGSFDYYEIGDAIFLEDGNLNESIGIEEIRRYVAFSENIPSDEQLSQDNEHSPYLLGFIDETAYFFIYEKDAITTLDLEFLANLNFKPRSAIIYADNCLLTREFMQKHDIIFKKIPREITRF
jgi:adenine-specific DNA-methyltransferase